MKLTQEQVIAWARESGGDDWGLFRDFMPEIERFATIAYEAGRKDENEACADWCAAYATDDGTAQKIEAAIRARREQ